MVWETSIEELDIPVDNTYRYRAFTVHADDHRILTVSSDSEATLSKWLNDVVKATKSNSPIVISVSAEHEFQEYTKRGLKDVPYDIFTFCAGSHCLVFNPLEETGLTPKPSLKPLRTFFENPRVVAVGMDMESLAKKLEREYGIKMKNAVDLRSMAVEGLKKAGENLDLWRYDLDKLAKTVLGKHVDVDRPNEKLDFFDCYYCWGREVTVEKTELATVDAYISFLVGSHLYDLIHGGAVAESSSKKKNSKKEKKNKNAS